MIHYLNRISIKLSVLRCRRCEPLSSLVKLKLSNFNPIYTSLAQSSATIATILNWILCHDCKMQKIALEANVKSLEKAKVLAS